MGENIHLPPVTPVGRSTWEPDREQETLFGGMRQRTGLKREYVKGLYEKLSKNLGQTPEAFHFDLFELRDGELYYKDKSFPLMRNARLRSAGAIAELLGKNRLRDLGFDIAKDEVTLQQIIKLKSLKRSCLPSLT